MTRSRSSSGRTKRSTARRTRARRRALRPTARPKPPAFKQAAVVPTTATNLKVGCNTLFVSAIEQAEQLFGRLQAAISGRLDLVLRAVGRSALPREGRGQ